jgi:hypothetical protein
VLRPDWLVNAIEHVQDRELPAVASSGAIWTEIEPRRLAHRAYWVCRSLNFPANVDQNSVFSSKQGSS